MKDRVPRYPGRVTLTPVSGQANTYDMARADDPTEAGTPLNTATLLTAATAQAIFGDSGDHTVNEALSALLNNSNSKAKIEVISYVGTGTYGSSNPTSATFSFVPKVVLFFGDGTQTTGPNEDGDSVQYPQSYSAGLLLWNTTTRLYQSLKPQYYATVTYANKTMSWYGKDAHYQYNTASKTYYLVAIA